MGLELPGNHVVAEAELAASMTARHVSGAMERMITFLREGGGTLPAHVRKVALRQIALWAEVSAWISRKILSRRIAQGHTWVSGLVRRDK